MITAPRASCSDVRKKGYAVPARELAVRSANDWRRAAPRVLCPREGGLGREADCEANWRSSVVLHCEQDVDRKASDGPRCGRGPSEGAGRGEVPKAAPENLIALQPNLHNDARFTYLKAISSTRALASSSDDPDDGAAQIIALLKGTESTLRSSRRSSAKSAAPSGSWSAT